MALDRLGEVGGSGGRGFSAVDDNGCGSMYMAVLAHPRYACRGVYLHYAISIGIDPAFAASRLLKWLNIAFLRRYQSSPSKSSPPLLIYISSAASVIATVPVPAWLSLVCVESDS